MSEKMGSPADTNLAQAGFKQRLKNALTIEKSKKNPKMFPKNELRIVEERKLWKLSAPEKLIFGLFLVFETLFVCLFSSFCQCWSFGKGVTNSECQCTVP